MWSKNSFYNFNLINWTKYHSCNLKKKNYNNKIKWSPGRFPVRIDFLLAAQLSADFDLSYVSAVDKKLKFNLMIARSTENIVHIFIFKLRPIFNIYLKLAKSIECGWLHPMIGTQVAL